MAARIPYFNPMGSTKLKPEPVSEDRKEANRFYACARWKKVRAWKLDQNPLCERCEAVGLTELAVHVHHVRDRRAHPELAFDGDNLESLCVRCHNSHHKSKPR
jgi:5-methylcytosine-specific restriction protein A